MKYCVKIQENSILIHCFLLPIIFHYKLLQDIGYNALCYTVNLCCFCKLKSFR